MSFLAHYDPRAVIVSIGSDKVSSDVVGFVDGTFVDVERSEDAFKKMVGATGDIVRTKINDRSGKIVLTLLAASPSNDDLWGLALVDEDSGLDTFVIQIKDTHGTMYVHAHDAWIVKYPKIERGGKDGATVTWTIDCADLEMRPGSNTSPAI